MSNIYNAIQNLYNMDKTTWQEVLAELYNLVANIENKFDLFENKFGPLLGKEVTRELKKMYDDGSLPSLINDKLLKDINTKVVAFKTELSKQMDTKTSFCNTITNLKNSNFKNGDIVKTLGYYNANDGGDGYYIVRIKKESDIEDNGLIHFLKNGLVAELIIIDKEVNILQFGAKNNKSKDIGLLVNNLLSKYKSVYIPKGRYLVENTIKPIGENTLKIDGALYYTGNESRILIETNYNKITTFDIFAEGNAIKLKNSTSESKCSYNYIDLKGFVRANNNHALILYSSQMGIN